MADDQTNAPAPGTVLCVGFDGTEYRLGDPLPAGFKVLEDGPGRWAMCPPYTDEAWIYATEAEAVRASFNLAEEERAP